METYFILEIQVNTEDPAAICPPEGYPISSQADRDRAKSAYYLKCSYPTTCAMRTLMVIDSMGRVVDGCQVTLMKSAVE